MTRARAWARRNWVLLGALCLFVGSDYKVRTRDDTASISGSPDVYVLIELALYAALAAYLLLRRASPPRAVRLPLPLALTLAYVLVIAISVIDTPFPVYGAVRTAEMVIAAGLAAAIARQAGRGDLHRLAHGFLVLVGLSVLYGLAVPSTPVSRLQTGRFTWLALHPNLAGGYVGVATVIAFVYLTRTDPRPGPHWPRWAYAAALAVVGYGLLATLTRGAVLGAFAGVVVAYWSSLRGIARRVEFLVAAAAVGGLAALLGAHTVSAYFARGETVDQLSTLNSRTDLWSYALDAFTAKPLYGWGVGASQGIFLDKIGLGGGHNMIVNVVVDLGLVGLAVWTALVVSLAAAILSLRRDAAEGLVVDRALLGGVLAMLLVDGVFVAGPGGVSNVGSSWLFLLVGWVCCLLRPDGGAASGRRRGAVTARPVPAPEQQERAPIG